MNWLKYKVLVIGGAIALLFAAAACFGLFHFQGKYSKAAAELKSAKEKLDRLNRRNPFPTAENVAIVQQNRDKMIDFVDSLRDDFRKGQVAEKSMEPAQFASFLEGVRRGVRARALAAQTKLPEPMSIGFGRYVAGEPPAAADIPRLVIQARTVAALGDVLFDAKIDELVDIQRIHFEGATAAGGAAPSVAGVAEGGPIAALLSTLSLPPVESNEFYSAERFSLMFLGREHSAWEVMNGLARCGLFAVVRHVEMANESSPKRPGAPGATPPAAAAMQAVAHPAQPGAPAPVVIYPPREERVVAGREQVRVTLVIDVYRFAAPATAEGAK